MAQQAPFSSPSFLVSKTHRILRLLLLQVTLAATAAAQTPQQQYVFGSVPLTPATSQLAAYAKNGQTGALSAVAGSPFADSLQGGAMAIDGLGHFLFVINTSTSNISMFQIDQSSGSLTQVPGSPFSTGPTENLSMAATSPVCLAAEKSGQFRQPGRHQRVFDRRRQSSTRAVVRAADHRHRLRTHRHGHGSQGPSSLRRAGPESL